MCQALAAIARFELAGSMVPSTDWFLYGFVRKEAVLTSQIEGTPATLRDILTFEATEEAERPEDVKEVCNDVDALTYARRELAKPNGLRETTGKQRDRVFAYTYRTRICTTAAWIARCESLLTTTYAERARIPQTTLSKLGNAAMPTNALSKPPHARWDSCPP